MTKQQDLKLIEELEALETKMESLSIKRQKEVLFKFFAQEPHKLDQVIAHLKLHVESELEKKPPQPKSIKSRL